MAYYIKRILFFIIIIFYTLNLNAGNLTSLDFFKINKSSYSDVVSYLKNKDFNYTENTVNFGKLKYMIIVPILDKKSDVDIMHLAFDKDNVLKAKIYYLNSGFNKYYNIYKKKYQIEKFNNVFDIVKKFVVFRVDEKIIGIMEQPNTGYLTIKFIDESFFSDMVNNLKQIYYKLREN